MGSTLYIHISRLSRRRPRSRAASPKRNMFFVGLSLCAFTAPPAKWTGNRRELVGHALHFGGGTAALLVAPAAMLASPAASPQAILKSRALYGSRVFRLQNASPSTILDEKNAFALFISGVYGATAEKSTRVQLEKLEKAALAAAKKGDETTAQAAIKDFVTLGQITELDRVPGTYYNAASPCDRAGLQCGFKADEVR